MEVKIINKSHHSLPQYATPLSAGMDIRANLTESVVLKPMERKLIPTGLLYRKDMRLKCVHVVVWL